MINDLNLLCLCFLVVYKRPENNYYFPDLHHMKYEIEDGTALNGRDLRFGFDPLAFPEFSWRGYAQMTHIQVCSQRPIAHIHTHNTLRGSQKVSCPPK
jgi:hypothetical protein